MNTAVEAIHEARELRAEQERQAQALADAARLEFLRLAHRLAGGEIVAPEDVLRILDAAGETEDTLQAAIGELWRRSELARSLGDFEALDARHRELGDELDRLKREVELLDRRRHEAFTERDAVRQTIKGRERIEAQMLACDDGDGRLARYRELRSRYLALVRDHQKARAAAEAATTQADFWQSKSAQRQADPKVSDALREEARWQLADWTQKRDEAVKRRDMLAKQLAAAVKAVEQYRRAELCEVRPRGCTARRVAGRESREPFSRGST